MFITTCERGHIVEKSDKFKFRNKKASSKYCNECKKEDIIEIISKKDGYLLYGNLENITHDTKLKVKCKSNHEWETTSGYLKCDSWCSICSSFKYENICRLYFEQIFNVQFSKIRPSFLKQENGFNLELDGFNENLKIAFEHNGTQHYKRIEIFNKIDSLEYIQNKDKFKKEMCEINGIKLFIIPQLTVFTKISDLKQLIFNQAKEFNMENIGNFNIDIDLTDLYDVKINEYKEIAKSHGGECLSNIYIDNLFKLSFKCKEGHQWNASPSNIKQGNWCKICSKKEKLTIEEMHDLAAKFNGKCLSEIYNSNQTNLIWQCSEGHIWEAIPTNIKYNNTWCAKCNGNKKLTIEDMQILANNKNGKCLSLEYKNTKSKLKWECSEGHIWYAKPNNIKTGTWCGICSNNKKMINKEMSK